MSSVTRRVAAWGLTAAALALGAAPAQAHVDVLPAELTLNEAQQVTVRVPNERDVPTTKVTVTFPAGVTVFAFGPNPPGWQRKALLTNDGRNRGVVWSGGRVAAGEYVDFAMLATPTRKGDAVWKTEQTYADGVTKPWTGPPEQEGAASQESGPADPGPAALTRISAEPAAVTGQSVARTSSDSSNTGTVLGAIALVLAAGAITGLGLLWSRTPATLPSDDDDAPEPAPEMPEPPPTPPHGSRSRKRRS